VKKSRFTEARIVAILKEADAGTPIAERARRHGLHANTIRLWRYKYGMQTSDLARLKQLEDESGHKDRIIARQALEIEAMKISSKKTAGALAAERRSEGLEGKRSIGSTRLCACRLRAQQSLLSPC
jgi:putative transposase